MHFLSVLYTASVCTDSVCNSWPIGLRLSRLNPPRSTEMLMGVGRAMDQFMVGQVVSWFVVRRN